MLEKHDGAWRFGRVTLGIPAAARLLGLTITSDLESLMGLLSLLSSDVSRGLMVIDDFQFQGCRKAVQEFL